MDGSRYRARGEDRVGEVKERVLPAAHRAAHRAVQPLAKSLQRREGLQWSVETRHLLRAGPG